MRKKLKQEQVARYERHEDRQFTNRLASRRIGLAVLTIGLLLAGCASGDSSSSERERRGGFYGGVSGGMGSHP